MNGSLAALVAWTAIVVLAMAFIIRPWRDTPARHPLPVLLGVSVAVWVLASSWIGLRALYAAGSWTAASVTTGLVPLKALALAGLAYAAGRLFIGARKSIDVSPARRWGGAALLGVLSVLALASDVRGLYVGRLAQHARSETLSSDEVQRLAEKLTQGAATDDEVSAFLANRLCPPALLTQYAASLDARWRREVARNNTISGEIAQALAADPDEEVRYMLAFNRGLSPALLSRLAADASPFVREMVAWTKALPEADFEKLVSDPSVSVRATAALQPRLSPESRAKLLADPEQRVRDAAARGQ